MLASLLCSSFFRTDLSMSRLDNRLDIRTCLNGTERPGRNRGSKPKPKENFLAKPEVCIHVCLYSVHTAPLAKIGGTTTKQSKKDCMSLAWTSTTPYNVCLDSPSFTFQFAKRLSGRGDRRTGIMDLQTALWYIIKVRRFC
jgi:hypothetical protein